MWTIWRRGEDIRKEIIAIKCKGEKWEIFRQPPEQKQPDLQFVASTSAQQQSQNPVQDEVQDDHVNIATQCQEHGITADSAATASVVLELPKMQNTVYEDRLDATPYTHLEIVGQLNPLELEKSSLFCFSSW